MNTGLQTLINTGQQMLPGFGFVNPDQQVLQGAGMFPSLPGFPPLNFSTSTSSGATAGDQTGGGFVAHGINFGTANHGAAASSTALLMWGAAALAVYFLVIKK